MMNLNFNIVNGLMVADCKIYKDDNLNEFKIIECLISTGNPQTIIKTSDLPEWLDSIIVSTINLGLNNKVFKDLPVIVNVEGRHGYSVIGLDILAKHCISIEHTSESTGLLTLT